ncbi:lactoylglutathione lyase-like lyase [Mycolicibacterium rhodesiae NBB3]|jgi:catechol 2,3-dioxygenase-like lactoylglutathione lyase family enzyme|uniref:Lactoylglutathione lyase-like lyase n=1 Tax=Mycolicibacterium rhodesiae (strain NBB3) TaxID=710685 RepID=G8RVY3_MYCRN|nr:VOC family protein [Mycolicibacterium rhodesiae]AEV76752.1 lactoylglutathione lyase-like lyase [Mycolicibacterium rhodesiae NBB3]
MQPDASDHPAPGITGIHHISVTVTDLAASLAWYQRLLGADHLPMKFPHYGCEDTGYGELLVDPRSGVVIGLHTNTGNDGQRFDEARTGLDHVALNVASRADLEAWTARLDDLGIEHSGIRVGEQPFPFATVVFRDPDNIQLELFAAG